MSSSSLRVIVSGYVAQYPLGGVAWDYLQYVLGLREMGHDAYYVEDSGQWPYSLKSGGLTDDWREPVGYLQSLMNEVGLSQRWAYRFPRTGAWFGLGEGKRRDVFSSADLVLNISGSLPSLEQFEGVPRRAYIDSDPGFTQLKLAKGHRQLRATVEAHDTWFSFGELIRTADLPETGIDWIPTRQPVVLSAWTPRELERDKFTTIMNWTSYKPVEFESRSFGQKDVEFEHFVDLPRAIKPEQLEMALNAGKGRRAPVGLLRRNEWELVDPLDVCPDLESYRSYISGSKAEWSVAKNGYVAAGSGWFSCRSACYLAAGRPVVVQDTGFSDVLPCGEGIVAFTDFAGAVGGIEDVATRYGAHALAAREIAETFFDSHVVLGELLEHATAGVRT